MALDQHLLENVYRIATVDLGVERVLPSQVMDELSISLWWAGYPEESARLCERLLANPALPPGERVRIEKNRAFGGDCAKKAGPR